MRMLGLSAFALLCGIFVLPASAAAETSSDAIESGRQALDSRRQLPWYDADQDTLRRIDVAPNEDDPKRNSSWAVTPRGSSRRRGGSRFVETILRVLAWTALSLFVALVIWALVWALTRRQRSVAADGRVVRQIELTKARIEDLPVPVSPQYTDLLAAARGFFEAGDFGKAIIYAFAHQLVELDKHHLIQLTRGKTNREYLSELRVQPRFIELLRPTMLAFEDVFFGHHELTRERFETCWENLDQFHLQLEQVTT